MSLLSEHSTPIVSLSPSALPQMHANLLALTQCPAIYNGDFDAAATQITRTTGQILGIERFGIWLYNDQRTEFRQVDTYLLSQNCHASGLKLLVADYPDYFDHLDQSNWLMVDDVAKSEQLSDFAQRWLLPHQIGALLSVPIRQNAQIIGAIWCGNTNGTRQWNHHDQTCALLAASLISLALETQSRQQNELKLHRQMRQHLLIKDIAHILHSAPDDQSILSQISYQLGQTLNAHRCLIWMQHFDEHQDDISCFIPVAEYICTTNQETDTPCVEILSCDNNQLFIHDHPYFQQLLTADTPVIFKELRAAQLKQLKMPTALRQEMYGCAAIRTLYQGMTNGFITLHPVDSERIWLSDEFAILEELAIYIGVIIAHSQLLAQEKEQRGTLSRQHRQLQREMIERQQAEQAWQESQHFINSILDASTNILYVNQFDTGQNIYISRWLSNVLGYFPEDIQAMGDHFLEKLVHEDDRVSMLAQRRKLAFISDGEMVEMEYRLRHRQGHWRWLMCRETVFQRASDGTPAQIFGTATDITERKQAEVALHEVNRELKRLANIDGLTQVANRRSFDTTLWKEWESIRYNQSPLTLILCDIDYFKRYNDAYGHQAGDVCLQKVAQAIARAVKRTSDMLARYGGEEFAIILPNTSLEGAQKVAEDIYLEVEKLNIPHAQSGVSNRVTVSLGISSIDATLDATPDALIAAADRGLYRAKYEGRNRFCIEQL
jgi:diguanylate cyclase (GGDEF)-like protein/PAS domain S-box-containing protein